MVTLVPAREIFKLSEKKFKGERVRFGIGDDARAAGLPNLQIVASRRKVSLVDVFHIIHEAGAAIDEIAIGAIVEKKIEVVDVGLVQMTIPSQGGGGGKGGAGHIVGHIEIVVTYSIQRGGGATGVGGEIPAGQNGLSASRTRGRMRIAGGDELGNDVTFAASELAVG